MIKITGEISQRLKNLSFLAACLVVALHVRNGFAGASIFSFLVSRVGHVAVPIFFFISGFLLMGKTNDSDWWRVTIRKKFQTLVIPYFCINLIYFPFVLFYRGGGLPLPW